MNKVVCNICGTSYPENVSACPICGFARSSDTSRENGKSTYKHVPGGRFSKANVRKRNQGKLKSSVAPVPSSKPSKKKEEKTSLGLVIVVILLLLAIIAVVGYIALRFFLPNTYLFEGTGKLNISSIFQKEEAEPIEDPVDITDDTQTVILITEPEPVLCEEVSLNQSQIECDAIGGIYQIIYQLYPADTQEEVVFSSSDETVATVDAQGLIVIKGEGSATITVSCGSVSAQCEVICALPTEAADVITLNRKEITFTSEGEAWLLYDGTIDVAEIVWTSDDNKVATIDAGKVVAVAEGDTTVYGYYEGQTVSCTIHCKFQEDDSSQSGGNVSEANGNATTTSGPYKLYNPYGNAEDVTLAVGKQFPLTLVDGAEKTVSDAQWTVEKTAVCSYSDGVVKGLAAGTTKVTATYEGKTYSCIVRVK